MYIMYYLYTCINVLYIEIQPSIHLSISNFVTWEIRYGLADVQKVILYTANTSTIAYEICSNRSSVYLYYTTVLYT